MENKNFKSVQEFRDKATEEDYFELKEYLNSLQKPSKEFVPNEKLKDKKSGFIIICCT